MDDDALKSRGWLLRAAALALGLAGLALLTQTVQNSDLFGRWYGAILVANATGALFLVTVLGANLARLQLNTIFSELLTRLPDIELAGPVKRLRSNFIDGIKEMPVRFTPESERLRRMS